MALLGGRDYAGILGAGKCRKKIGKQKNLPMHLKYEVPGLQ